MWEAFPVISLTSNRINVCFASAEPLSLLESTRHFPSPKSTNYFVRIRPRNTSTAKRPAHEDGRSYLVTTGSRNEGEKEKFNGQSAGPPGSSNLPESI